MPINIFGGDPNGKLGIFNGDPNRASKLNFFKNDPNSKLNLRRALFYMHFPEILPRLRAMAAKLGHFAFLLAVIFRSARLLPAGHPMLNPVNIGRFGIRDVLATAANNLVMKRDNMDQVMIFGAVVMAFIMIVIQAVLIGVYAFVHNAEAATTTGSGMFSTPSPDSDLAFQFLRNVFGVADIFGAGGASDVISLPSQIALHALLGFYSTAMMIIAVLIVIYYVITVVGESAQTGQPFGKRFNGLWAPVRLVLALGLLVPLGSGLNAAQYLTLQMAKFGSGLATQGWITYVGALSAKTSTVATLPAPSVQGLVHLVFSAEACKKVYNLVHNKPNGQPDGVVVSAVYPGSTTLASFSANDLTSVTSSQVITYSWSNEHPPGTINTHTCGAINVNVAPATASTDPVKTQTRTMQIKYLEVIGKMISDMDQATTKFAEKYVESSGLTAKARNGIGVDQIAGGLATAANNAQTFINSSVATLTREKTGLDGTLKAQMEADAKSRGWMSAGIYYSQLSRINRQVKDAVTSGFPEPAKAPSGDDKNTNSAAAINDNSWVQWFADSWIGGASDADKAVRTALMNLNAVVDKASPAMTVKPGGASRGLAEYYQNQGSGSSWFKWFVAFLFGDTLIELVDQSTLDPLTKMAQAGSRILDKAEATIYIAIAAETVGVVGATVGGFVGGGPAGAGIGATIAAFAKAAAIVLWFIVGLGILAGIVLFYILPLLPFMYFFMASTSWVIEVFEAFVAMPLWAIAHLRIDGEGMPGQTAMMGYMTLLSILLRPIMIVIGLIGATLIFGAGSILLNALYRDVVLNYREASAVAGGVLTSGIGPFGFIIYVILYVYILYMFAISCFKLVDMIPDKMLRWIGGPTPFTGQNTIDPGSIQGAAIAGYAAMSGAGSTVQAARGALADAAGSMPKNPPSSGSAGVSGGGSP